MLRRLQFLKPLQSKAPWGTWAALLLHCHCPALVSGQEAPAIFPIPAHIAPLAVSQAEEFSPTHTGNLRTVSYPDVSPQVPQGRIVNARPAENAPEYRIAAAPVQPNLTAVPAASVPTGNFNSQPTMMMVQPSLAAGNFPPGTQFMLVPVQVPNSASGEPSSVEGFRTASVPQNPSYMPRPAVQAAVPTPAAVAPAPVLRPEQLQGLTQQVGQVAAQGFQLAERNALYAARQKFEEALQLAAQGMDGQTGRNDHSQALADARLAFKEAEDFAPDGSQPMVSQNVQQIVAVHRTRLLQDVQPTMPPIAALQAYYRFGRQQTVQATAPIATAADALHGLGKVHSFLATEEGGANELHVARAIACQQAALDINPQHARAANELGVLLARHGQWHDAKQALVHSLRLQPRSETWHNLVVVHQRLGEVDLAQRAQYELSRLNQTPASPAAAPSQGVQWVEPDQFARQSPHPNAPLPGNNPTSRPDSAPSPTAYRPYPAANHYR